MIYTRPECTSVSNHNSEQIQHFIASNQGQWSIIFVSKLKIQLNDKPKKPLCDLNYKIIVSTVK